MDKLNKDFVNQVFEKYKSLYNIGEINESSAEELYKCSIAKISAEIFAISFNTLIREGYFQASNETTDKEQN